MNMNEEQLLEHRPGFECDKGLAHYGVCRMGTGLQPWEKVNKALGLMTKLDVFEDQRVAHVRNGPGTIEDIRGRHGDVVRVRFDNGETTGVWITDLTDLTPPAV